MKVLVVPAILATLAVAVAAAPENAPQPQQEGDTGDFVARPPPSTALFEKRPEMVEEGIREALVSEVKVEVQEPTTVSVVQRANTAQGYPAVGQLASIVAQYFPEQPAKALRVVMCESTGDPLAVAGAYHGLWQFDVKTWQSVGGVGLPSQASAAEQTRLARVLYNQRGWQPWPHCGRL